MTQTYYPFDAGAGSNVAESQWTKMARLWLPTGVIDGGLNELAVFADSTGLQVKVPSGRAWIEGHFFESDAQVTLAIAAAHPTNPRIDRVIVRVDWTANTIALAVLSGTAAGSPSAPALTQTTSTWEISLAQVAVAATATTIAPGDVTDERTTVGHVPGRFRGTGAPEGVIVAPQGSDYLQTDGTSGRTLWIKYGAGLNSTGWESAGGSSVAPNVISTMSQEMVGSLLVNPTVGASGDGYPAANRAIFVPFRLGFGSTLKRLFWMNGTAVSGNVCIGLYNASFTRLLTSGSVAQVGTSVVQVYDPTDTPLVAGLYYIGIALDNGSGRLAFYTFGEGSINDGAAALRAAGVFKQNTAFPLPNPAVPAAVTDDYLPFVGAEFGTLT